MRPTHAALALAMLLAFSAVAATSPGRPADKSEQVGGWKVASWMQDGREVRVVGVGVLRSGTIVAGGCEGRTTYTIGSQSYEGSVAQAFWRIAINDPNSPDGTRILVRRIAKACGWEI